MTINGISFPRDGTRALLDWYDLWKRPFPWRKTADPYKIWISEVMLQQTQAARVVKYYLRWMELFPTVQALAEAKEKDILKAWEGLGYYGRARNLQAAARLLAEQGKKNLPPSFHEMAALPGVGPYTAGAVASIAFGLPAPAVDANAKRVFSRLLDLSEPVDRSKGDNIIRRTFQEMLPQDRPGDFNQAVMELGAILCLPRSFACEECPLTACCLSRQRGTLFMRPVSARQKKGETSTGKIFVFLCNHAVFVRKRPQKGLWANFEEFPWEAPPVEPLFPFPLAHRENELDFGKIQCSFTKWRITLQVRLVPLPADKRHLFPRGRWVDGDELSALTLPAGSRKARKMLFDSGVISPPAQRPLGAAG